MNSRDGFFRAPLENQSQQKFQFMGSWIPVTPMNHQGGSSLVVDERVMHHNGVRGGGYEERGSCNNGVVQDLNYTVQGMHQHGVYDHGDHQGFSRMINSLEGSYAQPRSNSARGDLLGRSNAASVLAPSIRNTAGYGSYASDAGMVNSSLGQRGSGQGGYSGFELDDLLDPVQMPFSFTSLLSGGDTLFQVPQHDTPAARSRPLYNLNSPPRREEDGSICEDSFQSIPSTPNLRRTAQNNGLVEKIITTAGHEITEQKSDKSMQSTVDSPVVNLTEVVEQTDVSGQNDLGFDLNKTPQQKPSKRRKKFMPKVVVEGKPKRKPRKSSSQENVKPKETRSGKRKKDQKTDLKETATKKSAIVGDMSNTCPEIPQKSCRKALNFELEQNGDARHGDSESEIVENASGSNSFSETRDATCGTSGTCLDSVTQIDQTSGLVATKQPVEALVGNKLPRVLQENHSRILARDQQPELLIGNQQCQFPMVTRNTQLPMVTRNTQLPMGNQQDWLRMKTQLIGFPFGNQEPRMPIRNQQPCLDMGNQQPVYLMGTPRPVLATRNQQPGGLQENNRLIFLNQQTQQTCLPAGNGQYGSLPGMQQLVMSSGGQQHGLRMNSQQPGFLLRNQQPGSLMRVQQPCAPLMNQQPGTPKGFTHLNQMIAPYMSLPCLRPYPQSQTPTTNLHVESVSRSLNGTAGTCQRSSIPEYSSLQSKIHQGTGYIPYEERSNAEPVGVCNKALTQISSLPTPVMATHAEARGSKREYDCEMGKMQSHYLNPLGRWPLLQQIAQAQGAGRENINTCADYLDAAKKIKIQKAVQDNSHGMPSEVIEIEDDPTAWARNTRQTASKRISCQVQDSTNIEKRIVPKTPARKGPAGRKKSVAPPAYASEIQVYEPTLAKTPSSRSKAKGKGRISKQDSGQTRGPSGELLLQDSIAEIIYRLEELNIGDNSREQGQNALVLYRGDGAVVPYETKKRKPRPKVDLDDETTRIWNLLMGKGEKEGDEDMDKKKEKWWEEERRVFRGRADSFIARMHLVQGDRRFSPWKGSVVDSVIGVFLTQNVTDHLSSSAFMSLAARFPPKSSSNQEYERNIRSVVVEDPEECMLNLNDIQSWQERVQNPSDTPVSGVDSGSKEHQRSSSNSGIEKFNFLENNSQNLEEEVLSSQDSFDPAIFQSCGRVGSCSGSNPDAEFSTPRCEAKTVSGSAQSVQTGSPNLSDDNFLQSNESLVLYGASGDVKKQESANVAQKKPDLDKSINRKDSLPLGQSSNDTNFQKGQTNTSSSYEQSTIRQPEIPDMEDFGMRGEGIGYSWLSIPPRADSGKSKKTPKRVVRKSGTVAREFTGPSTPHGIPAMGLSTSSSTDNAHQGDAQQNTFMDLLRFSEECLRGQSSTTQNIIDDLLARDRAAGDVVDPHSNNKSLLNIMDESDSSNKERAAVEYDETNATIVREIKGTLADGKKPTSQWDSLRKNVVGNEERKERNKDSMDSIDYEAIRRASISEISEAIKERGMNNMLAVRIKDFLERIDKDHGAVDLEWLRDVPADKAKDYLLSIRGLGLKSVECVRLLTLHNLAFPVDTNVGRIAVRLGWVPLQPLPESLQLHLLELYPVLESIQKFLWPRLCQLDQPTLYELHYQLITFGKVFCTKSKPNCNACPMRGECRHFASAYASARLALPAPEERSLTSATIAVPPEYFPPAPIPMMQLPPPLEKSLTMETPLNTRNSEPIIEEPATPEQECTEITESDIEDAYYNEDPDEIPIIELNIKQFGMTLREHMEKNMALQEGDMSKALVALNPTTTSIPTPKLKNISRLRTEHQVYQLPDSHPLLNGMEKREPDDQSPYLLAIWTPGETANSAQPPKQKCGGQPSGKMCFEETCSECNSVRESNSQTVRGTLLIPCRTAMRGSFPLNGTYFQVNELFADHDSSLKPIDVPRDWIWSLPRRTVYFGTSVTSIFRGLSTEQIQYCFWKGFICVRGFEQKTRAPRPLMARLHFPASKMKNRT
ncbi:unnamed protein product [Cochlearia groenlandica]